MRKRAGDRLKNGCETGEDDAFVGNFYDEERGEQERAGMDDGAAKRTIVAAVANRNAIVVGLRGRVHLNRGLHELVRQLCGRRRYLMDMRRSDVALHAKGNQENHGKQLAAQRARRNEAPSATVLLMAKPFQIAFP